MMFFNRKLFIGMAILAICSLGVPAAFAQPLPGGTLDPTTVPKYVQPLVIPPVMNNDGTGANNYDIAVRQFQQQILPGGHWNAVSPACIANPGLCNLPATTVWSYGPAADPLPDSSGIPGGAVGLAPALNSQFNYPAFTVENTINTTTMVDWINDLVANPWPSLTGGCGTPNEQPGDCNFIPYLIPGVVDQTLHWANPPQDCISGLIRTDCRGQSQVPYMGPNPIITHVHGAHVGPESDGYPEAWYLPAADNIPPGYATQGTLVNQYGTPTNNAPGVASFTYPNTQPSTTLWYHDHTLGMTRLNVYAGPAGYWLIRDVGGGETGLISGTLPGPAPVAGDDPNFSAATRAGIREIPIVIQDRSFNADGSLFYPDNRAFFEGVTPNKLKIPFIGDPKRPSDISPIWNPEAFFNTMVVNGTTWPVLNVAQAKYRFRLLNGCNSRFLNLAMFVVNPDGTLGQEIPFYQIGAEQSLLPSVVTVFTGSKGGQPAADPQEALLMGLAERADVIVDFENLPNGTRVRMINTAPDAPFGGFPDIPADPGTTGQVMEFVVDNTLNGASPTDPGGATPATDPSLLVFDENPGGDPPLGDSSVTRDLALLEEESAAVCVNVRPNGTVSYDKKGTPDLANPGTCIDKKGRLRRSIPFAPKAAVLGTNGAGGGTVQLWSDPIAQNPVSGATETWELWNWSADAHPIHLHLVKFSVMDRQIIAGAVRPPEVTEAGWKDTVIAYPGEITRLKAEFDIDGLYVWHCHIVEHEDNEMMVPYCVGDKETAPGCGVVP
jgi:FtsP/CotA-like multicopper oxidase with cupredoxin domain